MNSKAKSVTLKSTFIAVFAALICVGCFISIPLPGGVPITVQNMFATLAGTILGSWYGAAAVGVWIILGGIGVPVFSGMKHGFAHLFGATGGFILGYLLGALAAGLILGSPKDTSKKINFLSVLKIIIAYGVALVLNYIPGVLWFIHVKGGLSETLSLNQVLGWTVWPFIPGDLIKWVVAVILTVVLRPVAAGFLYTNSKASKKSEKEAIKKLKEKENAAVQAEIGNESSEENSSAGEEI